MGESVNDPGLKEIYERLKAAAERKDIVATIEAGHEYVYGLVNLTKSVADGLKQGGLILTNEDKHASVLDTADAIITPWINKAVDLPFLNEEQEAKLFGTLVRTVIGGVIKKAVKFFNKNGWNVKVSGAEAIK